MKGVGVKLISEVRKRVGGTERVSIPFPRPDNRKYTSSQLGEMTQEYGEPTS